MKELNVLLPGIMFVLSLAAILIVLLLTILRLLKAASFFQGKIAVIMALCISLLFIIGMSQLLIIPGGMHNITEADSGASVTVNYLLLPCVALAVASAVVLSQILLLASRVPPDEEFPASGAKTEAKESESPLAKPKSRGRPKKKEPEHSPGPEKSGGKGKTETEVSDPAEGPVTN